MTAAYLVKTRKAPGCRIAARYPGEARPPRKWRTRFKAASLHAAKLAAAALDRADMYRTGPRLYEVGIFHKGRRVTHWCAATAALAQE